MLAQSGAPLQRLLQTHLYTFDQLSDFSTLSNGMLKYDLLIVPPRSALSPQSARNLASYVHSGHSVLLIGEITPSDSPLLEEMFGYTNSKLPSTDLTTVKLGDNQHPVTEEFEPREFQIACQQGFWQSKTTTAEALAVHCNSKGEILAPAITVNKFGRGRAVYFDFEPKVYGDEVWVLLRNSIDWLLKE